MVKVTHDLQDKLERSLSTGHMDMEWYSQLGGNKLSDKRQDMSKILEGFNW